MPDETKNTDEDVTTTSNDASPTPAADVTSVAELAASMGGIADTLATLLERTAPAATQTDVAGIDQAEDVLRDRAAEPGANMPSLEAQMLELDQKRDALAKEQQKLRSSIDFRRSSYSMGEAMDRMQDEAQVCRAETRDFWQHKIVPRAVGGGAEWNKLGGDMKPVELLLRGGLVAGERSYEHNGMRSTFTGIQPFTAGANDPVLREAQDQVDAMFYWRHYRKAHGEEHTLRDCPWYPRYERAMTNLAHALPLQTGIERAMTATTLANWVPTGFSARLIERFELEFNLLRFIPFFQMSQNPENISRRGARLRPRKHTSSASNSEDISTKITVSDMTPGRLALNLHQFVFRVAFDIEAEEDTIPQLVPNLIVDLARSWQFALEDAILNSSDAIEPVPGHIDVDVTATDDYLTSWQGLRPEAIARSYTTSLNTFDADTVVSGQHQDMGKYSADPNRLISVVGAKAKAKLKFLRDSSGNPLVHGAASPSMPASGVAGRPMFELDGSPMVVSEAAREDLNASGFFDGSTVAANQTGTVMWVNTDGWLLAARNQAGRTFTTFNTETAQHEMLQHFRYEFEDNLDSSTERTVNLGIDVTFP